MSQETSSPEPAPHRFQRRGISFERAIKYFFASNAGLTLVILALIIVFLLKEGLGFFPGYRRELEIYRVAGLEFVDLSRKNLTAQEELSSVLNRAYYAEINGKCARELQRSQEASSLYHAFTDQTSATRDLVLNHSQAEGEVRPQLLATLKANYEKQKSKAFAKLPATPHLSSDERAALIDSIRARALETDDEPPLVTALAEELAAAQAQAALPLHQMRDTLDEFSSSGSELATLVSEMTDTVRTTKEQITRADDAAKERKTLMAAAARAKDSQEREKLTAEASAIAIARPDTHAAVHTLLERKPQAIAVHAALRESSAAIARRLPHDLTQGDAQHLLRVAVHAWPVFLADLDQTPAALDAWNPDLPVPLTHAIRCFLTGKDWVTGGEWQDFYGILPLAIGSLMISLVALVIAIPSGIGAAIYVNQFASRTEQAIVKPIIEFIQAIPSVVLGFIGILVFGTVLRDISLMDSLQWIPGFPIEERLNIFTAGCLLALMSIPTIFSLAEDAINNVPGAYSEASEALGASRVQTTFRVVIPAAFSGILAAILLGLGRVIGETMVVLLVAGNRIKIPDFTAGLGTVFQPTHTLTGIIAQELGEVPIGSVHYRALFVVGILLFGLVLAINATAHRFVNRMKP
jgi:phosphate transport system permease protein